MIGCFVILCSVLTIASSSPVVRDGGEMVDLQSAVVAVNSRKTSWTARINPGFESFTLAEARCLTGVKRENVSETLPPAPHLLGGEEDNWIEGDAPTNFDGRERFYGCIGSIRNQGECGSCWAFGATSALADRLCIYSSTIDVILSPQQLVSCDTSSYGCEGGYITQAWEYMKNTGVVTEDCYAYKSGSSRSTGSCYLSKDECPSSSYVMPKFYCAVYGAYSLSGVNKIMHDIYAKGPVEAALEIYEDFYVYSSGVYKYTYGGLIGLHAVKILGWGVDNNGYPFWLCANSWDTTWGDLGGYFKILKGYNECEIESYIVAG